MTTRAPVYMDYQATTPLDERVLAAMMPYLTTKFGNPHSADHSFGWEGEAALDVAREQVADLIGANSDEITFLSGATEANNMVIKGVMGVWRHKKPHLITVATEHKCVLEAAAAAHRAGAKLTVMGVCSDGLIDLNALSDAISGETAMVSVMAVNNEIGVIQPIAEIGALCRERGVLFHTDAAQAYGKIPLDVAAMNIDFMSISAHKLYGPKGVGALYLRNAQVTSLPPLMHGGGQEHGLRSGTQSPALVAGLGAAAALASEQMATDHAHLRSLSDRLVEGLHAEAAGCFLNGSATQRFAGNVNICFPGLDGSRLLADIRGLAVSSGAACASAVSGPSYVLEAIGLSEREAASSLRFGLGRYSTNSDVDYAIEVVAKAVTNQRGCKPREATV